MIEEQLTGFVATGCGKTALELVLRDTAAELRFHSQWMGDAKPFELILIARRAATGSHSGALVLESARFRDGGAVPLPPADGPIVLEYARVPPQRAELAGSDAMAMAGAWTDPWSCLLWLHADSIFDDGTELPEDDYDPPVTAFAPVVKVLKELERPWKLG